MMKGAPAQKTLFHFSGDGVFWPKAILAATIHEAEAIWHKIKTPISQTSNAPAVSPPAPPEEDEKVEDKPIDNENV